MKSIEGRKVLRVMLVDAMPLQGGMTRTVLLDESNGPGIKGSSVVRAHKIEVYDRGLVVDDVDFIAWERTLLVKFAAPDAPAQPVAIAKEEIRRRQDEGVAEVLATRGIPPPPSVPGGRR